MSAVGEPHGAGTWQTYIRPLCKQTSRSLFWARYFPDLNLGLLQSTGRFKGSRPWTCEAWGMDTNVSDDGLAIENLQLSYLQL